MVVFPPFEIVFVRVIWTAEIQGFAKDGYNGGLISGSILLNLSRGDDITNIKSYKDVAMGLQILIDESEKELWKATENDPQIIAQIGAKSALGVMRRISEASRKNIVAKLKDPSFKQAFLADKVGYWTMMGAVFILPYYALNKNINILFFGLAFIVGCVIGYRIDAIFQRLFGSKAQEKARELLIAWTPYRQYAVCKKEGNTYMMELESEMSSVFTNMVGDPEIAKQELRQEMRKNLSALAMPAEETIMKQARWMGVWLGMAGILLYLAMMLHNS